MPTFSLFLGPRPHIYNGSLNNTVHLFNFALIPSLPLNNFEQQLDFIKIGCNGTFHKRITKTYFHVRETLDGMEFFVNDFGLGSV